MPPRSVPPRSVPPRSVPPRSVPPRSVPLSCGYLSGHPAGSGLFRPAGHETCLDRGPGGLVPVRPQVPVQASPTSGLAAPVTKLPPVPARWLAKLQASIASPPCSHPAPRQDHGFRGCWRARVSSIRGRHDSDMGSIGEWPGRREIADGFLRQVAPFACRRLLAAAVRELRCVTQWSRAGGWTMPTGQGA